MKAGNIVKLKDNFREELSKLGFCEYHACAVSMGFKGGLMKIAYIQYESDVDIDFAVFSPFFKVPVQYLELASGKDLIRNYKIMKQNSLKG